MTIGLWLVAILGSIGLCAMPRLVAIEASRRRNAALNQRAFYSAATPVLSDDDVPLEIIDIVAWMGDRIDDATLARKVFGRVLRRSSKDVEGAERLDAAVASLRPELRAQFEEVERFFLLSLSYSARIAGTLWRRAVRVKQSVSSFAPNDLGDDLPTGPSSGVRMIYAKAA